MTRLSHRYAATGPVFAESRSTELAVRTVLRGPQDRSVRPGEDAAGRYVAVRIGRVLIYGYDEDTIAVHVAAWRQAETRARRSFPPEHIAKVPDLTGAASLSVGSAVLHVTGTPGYSLSSATTPAVAEPFVRVSVGSLVSVAYDAAAVATALASWTEAEQVAEDWLRPDPDNLTPAAIAAAERAARRLRSRS